VYVVLIAGLCACRPAGVSTIKLKVRVEPAALDFGRHWTLTTPAKSLLITNESRLEATADVSLAGLVFSAPSSVLLPPGDTEFTVTATSSISGENTGSLTLRFEGQELTVVPLTATFLDAPDCGDASECASFRFDRQTSQCVIEARPDGASCGSADRCLVNGRCVSGECVGQPVTCAADDPCTVAVCETVSGCVTLPRECPNPSQCLVGVCSKDRGCASVPVLDGLRCGNVSRVSCTAVDVCVNGQCVERDPPDGFICSAASPCREEGRCQNDVCVVPIEQPLPTVWSAGGTLADGGPSATWNDIFIAGDAGVVLSSYFATPPIVQAPTGQRLATSSRRCIAWNDLVVCADGPARGVTAVSSATGQTAWTYVGVLSDLPALALPDWETFLARLVALGPTRIGALFESRRLDDMRQETNCRRFSLVVLDDSGRRVVARIIDDPIFLTCNHPHSYGVASDPQGNVFFAFTPSAAVSPALPDPNAAGTVIMSYSPAGIRRWRHFVPNMPGGEIAVGRGLLTVEAGRAIYDAARGVVVDSFSIPFGEGLITDDWVVAGPKGLSVELRQPRADGGTLLLQATTMQSSRSGLRGATWSGQPVALRLVESQGTATLEAFSLTRFQSGTVEPLWACKIPDGGAPVSFEVKPNGLAVMTDPVPVGAGLCENCDPPFAGTRGRFFEVEVRGLGPPSMPWPGPWGGAGHDHQED
jgi:hypothetical protein